jgi:hypothetical protein
MAEDWRVRVEFEEEEHVRSLSGSSAISPSVSEVVLS